MRLVFAGTPEFARKALAALLGAGHDVALVLTQPDRAAGRGLAAVATPVKHLSLEHSLEIYQPSTLKSTEARERVQSADAQVLVVAAYGLLLPAAILKAARYGAINIHASLLPRWRGAAPIQRAILAGDRETGISIMQMDAGLDTGPVLDRRSIAIAADDDAGSLHDRLAVLGAEMILNTLAQVEAGAVRPAPQDERSATYAAKIAKQETVLDWRRPATELERAVRAFRPLPGAVAMLGEEPLKVWRARVVEAHGAPGRVLAAHEELVIGCGEHALAVAELQRPGGRRLPAAQFLRGHPIAPGTELALPRG